MNIKTRLSFQFTLIVTGILLLFATLTYYLSFTSQLAKFREELLDGAKNNAILLIDVAEVDSALLKKIHQSTISWEKEETAITDSAFNLIYGNNIQYLSDNVIRRNASNEEISFFTFAEKDGVYYKHFVNNRVYNVYVMAYDQDRIESLTELRGILLWSILFNICIAGILSYLFSKRAILPIARIIRSVEEINSSSLNNRLNEGKRKDEIDHLAITFNEMLANLEIAFKNQEDFVSSASHELRTPLTVMIVESDYILNRKCTRDEYVNHIKSLVNDLKKLNTLLNSLLEMAQINSYNSIHLSEVRIDEIIYNAIQITKARYPDRKILLKIQYPEDEKNLHVIGNAGLLTIAFRNLIDNACKFSEDVVMIEILISDRTIKVIISDKGVGIPPGDLKNIYKPFRRASNVKFKSGFGIGLSLVNKIITLHGATISLHSIENEGTQIGLSFNKSVG